MRTDRVRTHLSQRSTKQKLDFQLSPQATRSLSNTLILTLSLLILMMLSVSHIYFLILIALI
jgi:hypothetical protein